MPLTTARLDEVRIQEESGSGESSWKITPPRRSRSVPALPPGPERWNAERPSIRTSGAAHDSPPRRVRVQEESVSDQRSERSRPTPPFPFRSGATPWTGTLERGTTRHPHPAVPLTVACLDGVHIQEESVLDPISQRVVVEILGLQAPRKRAYTNGRVLVEHRHCVRYRLVTRGVTVEEQGHHGR